MKIAVITPYCDESAQLLERCQKSVAEQTYPATHILVSDGGAIALPNSIRLPVRHCDYGDTPRLIGTLSAYQQGYDAICWLDADCWFDPDHIATLVRIAEREVVPIVTATRRLVRADGSILAICRESDGDAFCDTNCYLVMRDAIPKLAPLWGFKPASRAVVGDRIVWEQARRFDRRHSLVPTVNYTTAIGEHYLAVGEPPPPDARVIARFNGETNFSSRSYWDLVDKKEIAFDDDSCDIETPD